MNPWLKNSRTKAILALAVVLLTASGFYFVKRHSGAGTGDATIGVVKKGELVQRITVAGTVIPKKRTAILPPYNGYVKKMYVKIGESLKAGDPVVSMVQSLGSVEEVYPIRAPFPGTVVQVLHSDGEYVTEQGDNSMLVRIDDVGTLYIMADVPELDLVKLKVGLPVIVKATAILGRSYKGVIREISLAAREKKEWSRASDKVEFPIKIEITDKDEQIKSGMSTLVDIISDKREDVLTLRHEYIQKSGDQYFVLLENGTRKDIQVGLQNEEMFEITKGLNEGDRVRQVDFLSAVQNGN